MIPYVQFRSSLDIPPPYSMPGVTVHAFVWDAPVKAVQAYCDRYFNLGDAADRGWTYGPAAIWPYVMLLVIDYPVMSYAGPPTPESDPGEVPLRDRGYVSQQEVFVAIPVMRRGTTPAKLLMNSSIEMALPFIVVGEPMSAVCGREMLGLEKLLADITLGESACQGSFSAQVRLPGWASLNHLEPQQMLPFLEVETGPAAPTFHGTSRQNSLWTLFDSQTVGKAVSAMTTVGDFVETASVGLLPTSMNTVSLKQIRDAKDPDRALHQSLVCCRSKYSCLENFRFFKEDDVKVTFHNQGSFCEILKVFLDVPENTSVDKSVDRPFSPVVKAAFKFNANIHFDDMRTLHTFAVSPGPGLPPAKIMDDTLSQGFRLLRNFLAKPAS